MKIDKIINELFDTGNLSTETISAIEENDALRLELVQYFDANENRELAIHFLNILTELRRNQGISGDSLLLACLILGKHKHIEDCLKIWETKEIDWDTHHYIDIQLVVFCGVQETIEYLKSQHSKMAKNALEYIIGCSKAGDFDDIENYFKTPWFV